jgi:hypothetical protein
MKNLNSKRALVAASALSLVVGAGGAIAASKGSAAHGDGFLARVAGHLGISTQKLEDATKAAAIDQVNADLQAGKISQAQADAMKARIQKGEVPLFFGGPHRFGPGGPHRFGPGGPHRFGDFGHERFGAHDHLSSAAGYLGLTVPQLFQKLANGQSLADVAKAQHKSVDGLKTAILDGAKKDLDQAVKDGFLTEAQATEAQKMLEARIDDIVNGRFPGPGMPPRFHWRAGPPDNDNHGSGWRMPAA